MAILISTIFVFLVLVLSELWWRKRQLRGEVSRKFVHITVGSFVAFWPYFMTATEIKLLSVAFLIVVIVSKYLHVLQAIHSVQRPTLGEVWFAVVVGALAFATGHPHIFTAALLTMSLADGLAAIIGTKYGNRHRYIVFGSPKTIIGTATFFVVSCLILIGYSALTPGALYWPLIAPIAIGATILENVAVRGLDNLVVPLFIAGCLLLLA
jgi:dolichol kinase